MPARQKELPYSFWLFDIATQEHPDAAAREVALWQQVLRDLPPDAPYEHRLDATVAFLEALFPYMGLAIPADLAPDPWQRLEQLADKIPLRPLPWPTGLPRGSFRWVKARAVLDVVSGIDRPKVRVEVRGSRVVYHRTQDGARVKPLLDMPGADVRKSFQGETYRWLLDVLTLGEHEPAAQPEAISLSGEVIDEDGAPAPLIETLGPYRRRNGAVTSQTITNFGVPLTPALRPSKAERQRTRAQVDDLRSIASPSELRFIETILETGYSTQRQFADHIGRTPGSVNEMVGQLRQKAVRAFPWAAAIGATASRAWREPAPHPGCKTCGGSGWIRSNSSRLERARDCTPKVVYRGRQNDAAQLDRFLDDDKWRDGRVRAGIAPRSHVGSAAPCGTWRDAEGPSWPAQLTVGHWSLGDLTRLADLDPMNEKAVREGLWLGGGLLPRKEPVAELRQPCPGERPGRPRDPVTHTLRTPCI